MTYDEGDLEILTLAHGHEHRKSVLGNLIVFLAFELGIPLRSGGSNTLRKKLRRKGLEPDTCFWIAHEQAMRGKEEFDPDADPPPDLVVEIDVTSSSLDRMGIYAALDVPEIWRWHRGALKAYLLNEAGDAYEAAEASRSFPQVPVEELNRFVSLASDKDETTVLREFVAWVRRTIVPGGNGGKKRKGRS